MYMEIPIEKETDRVAVTFRASDWARDVGTTATKVYDSRKNN